MGNEMLITFGWVSLMLIVGSFMRYNVGFLQRMLIPSSAIGGIIGFLLINFGIIHVTIGLLQTFVAQLFIISFISIGLQSIERKNEPALSGTNKNNTLFKGVLWFAIAWGLFVNLQAFVGMLAIKLSNLFGDPLSPMYGILLPFGFSMGTGQAISYGAVAEEIGLKNAASVAITFAVVGYVLATFVGIPLARYGIKKGLAKHSEALSENLLKGVVGKDTNQSVGKSTFHSSNMETITFQMALIGAIYLIAYFTMTWVSQLLPPNLASFVAGSLFIFGVLWAIITASLIKKLKVDHLFSGDLQKSITGWTVDIMVVASFMSVSLLSIQQFLVPIIMVTTIGAIVTTVGCFFIGSRMGSNYDFERSISFYGLVTGQVPNSLLLLRIVDPHFKTTPILEIALYNSLLPVTLAQIFLGFAPIIWDWNEMQALLLFGGSIVVYLVLLKVFGLWNSPTYSLFNRSSNKLSNDENTSK